MNTQVETLRAKLQQHIGIAHTLLPQNLIYDSRFDARNIIELNKSNLNHSILILQNLTDTNDFSRELLHEIEQGMATRELLMHSIAVELIDRTSNEDKQVIGECIRAVADGYIFGWDEEIYSVTGFRREQYLEIAKTWPHSEDKVIAAMIAVSALGNVYCFPRNTRWEDYMTFPLERVVEIGECWREMSNGFPVQL